MADKSVSELIAAQSVTPSDLFVLEQNGTAKKLTGQILENWLVSFADGHGGIQSIVKIKTNVLADTYRITLADTTTFDFVVTNGRGVNSITKKSTSGLVDTYTITYNDGTTGTFTVTNGEKGEKGDNAYIWVKYASQEPTADSSSFGDIPDDWIGIYVGTSETAPISYSSYKWYQIKGEKGETGAPATLVSSSITYQVGGSGTIIPSGSWQTSVPSVTPGKFLWTRQVLQFNTGAPITSYSVSRFGIDGSGAVSSVAGVAPDENGNVPLDASSVKALPIGGGTMEGAINMNGKPIGGLNNPTENDQAANMGFVNQQVKKAAPRNLLDNSDFRNPVNQRGSTKYMVGGDYTIDRWNACHENGKTHVAIEDGYLKLWAENTGGGSISQRFIKDLLSEDKKYTFAYKTNEGNIVIDNNPVVYGEAYDHVEITLSANETVNVEWIALYEGEYTLETLPPYVPKGYGVELVECKRYFNQIAEWSPTGVGAINYNGTSANIVVPIGVVMRTNPTVSGGKQNSYLRVNGQPISCADATITARPVGAYLVMNIVVDGLINYASHLAEFDVGDTPMLFSADL